MKTLVKTSRRCLEDEAGETVDQMLEQLAPLLGRGDIVIDGGDSFFRDTQRREAAMRAREISFVGMGVLGGEEGARYGPLLMRGRTRHACCAIESVNCPGSPGS